MKKHPRQHHEHLPPSLLSDLLIACQHLFESQLHYIPERTSKESRDTLHHGSTVAENFNHIHTIHGLERCSQLWCPGRINICSFNKQTDGDLCVSWN